MDSLDSVMELNKHNPVEEKNKNTGTYDNVEGPHADFYTVKVDAGIGEDDLVTFSCVMLDDKANPVVSFCKKDVLVCSLALVECLALRWSMEMVKSLNLRKVIFQTDEKLILDCVNQIVKDASLELVADDYRSLMKSFMFSNIVFIPRNLNFVAHPLDQLEKYVGLKTWMGVCPLVEVSPISLYSCCK